MKPLQIMRADTLSAEALRRGMCAGFSDYAVAMNPSPDGFAFMMTQRGFTPEASWAAVEQGRVVAVWLVSVEGPAAYLISSGTDPAFRGRGVAGQMALRCLEALKAAGIETFQTEVMAGNDVAARLYEKLGMRVHREMACYDLTRVKPAPSAADQVTWTQISAQVARWRDWAPTWQNSDAALARVAKDVTCLALTDSVGLVGYACLFAPNGAMAQLAVRPDMRRKGIATRLLGAIRAHGADRVLNVDAGDAGFQRFLQQNGAVCTTLQHERLRALA
ncbi:MAG: GNAT family N-acetyltransferase [Sulfitobacter sp.]